MGNEELVEVVRNHPVFLYYKTPRDERVLEALGKADRAEFLPEYIRNLAYLDRPLSIGHLQTCSQPSVVAFMADVLELSSGMNVLEVGTGCGYHAAVTAHLVGDGRLTTVEIIPELAEMGRRNLENHFGPIEGKIDVIGGDGSDGHPPNAPYHRIYYTAAADMKKFQTGGLLEQLVEDDGILMFPATDANFYFYRKLRGGLIKNQFFGVEFVGLTGKYE